LAVFAPLPCLICFVKPFAADGKLSLAASGCEKEKKKEKRKEPKTFLTYIFPWPFPLS
jgi:hypothetical protein